MNLEEHARRAAEKIAFNIIERVLGIVLLIEGPRCNPAQKFTEHGKIEKDEANNIDRFYYLGKLILEVGPPEITSIRNDLTGECQVNFYRKVTEPMEGG